MIRWVRRPPTRTRNSLTEQIKITQIIGSLFHFIFWFVIKVISKKTMIFNAYFKKFYERIAFALMMPLLGFTSHFFQIVTFFGFVIKVISNRTMIHVFNAYSTKDFKSCFTVIILQSLAILLAKY